MYQNGAGAQRTPRQLTRAKHSYEADLFKYLIRDLSTGGVIRQQRETDAYGNFVRKESSGRRQHAGNTMKSAFDDNEPYILTDLEAKFVHYVMEDVAPQLNGDNDT